MRSIREVMKGNLLVFTIGDAIRQLSMFITFPYFSLYVIALGGSPAHIGIVNSLRPVLSLFIYPIAGYLSDRYNRVRILTTTSYLTAVLWLVFLFAPDWRVLAIGNFFMGAVTFYFPAANSLMADSIPEDHRGTGYSLWYGIPGAIGVFSPFIGGYLVTTWGVIRGMRFLYALTFMTSIGIATMNLRNLKDNSSKQEGTRGESILRIVINSYRDVVAVLRWFPRNLRYYSAVLAISFFCNNLVGSYWVIYAIDVIGLEKLQWGTVLLMTSVVNVSLLYPAGIIVDRIGARRVLTLALLASSISLFLFPFSRGFWEVALIVVLGSTVSAFLNIGAPAYMAESVPQKMRGRVMAAIGQGGLFINMRGGGGGGPAMGAILTIPAILGSLLGGFIYQVSPQLPWFFMGTAMIVCAMITAFVMNPLKVDLATD
ncbi:MAG: MFS transporter [Candidatus Bathyarchaeota archaeon]|nr:MFS transporter [Candidatus Bathyarchaeota archaeon]